MSGVVKRGPYLPVTQEALAMAIRPDEIIDPDLDPGDQDDDWDDWECPHDTAIGELVRRLLGEMRSAAGELEGQGPAGQEVGRWLRRRAQQAAIQLRQLGHQP